MIDKIWFYPPRRDDIETVNKVCNWIKKNSLVCQYPLGEEDYLSCIFLVIEDHVILTAGVDNNGYFQDNWTEIKFKKEKFKPGELVITRHTASSEWFVTTFSHIVKDKFFCGDGCLHYKCYPLKGNEMFVGTCMNIDNN